jgi:UDPglucose 6-dehydrogenase
MKVAVIGTGYVGLVVGTCLADLGNNVICVDIDKRKIEKLRKGQCPIYEPGLEEMIKRNLKRKRLAFTTNTAKAVKDSYVIYIAVGTPQAKNGRADLKYVRQAAEQIGKAMNGEKIIVNKSTVPVGTAELVKSIIAKHYKGEFHVVSNPEFLREGSAIDDFLRPDRIVVGYESPKAKRVMQELYKPIKTKKFYTDLRTAELIKYASNAFLATKISFINEIAMLCDKLGANVKDVAIGVGLDKRIGKHFLRAGCGWGGSCFPKDVSALIYMGKKQGVPLKIATAAKEVNASAKVLPVRKLKELLGTLKGKRIAVLGLAFKPNTDDMREASSITIIKQLKKAGAEVVAYDPIAEENARRIIPDITYCPRAYDALREADAAILVTEWPEFANLNLRRVKRLMRNPVIVDGRNFLNKKKLKDIGFVYEAIGV